jgi:hypothetical protein
MKNNRFFKRAKNAPVTRDEVLKTTSLLYIKEALCRERYEDCAELIRFAKEFGADQGEISGVIAEHNGGEEAAKTDEANQGIGGRLRFY